MIIGMRGHDFGRMEPAELARAIAAPGFRATQLAFTKAFPQSADVYMTDEKLREIRAVFEENGVSIPVMGCYISAADADPAVHQEAKRKFADCLRASVILGAGCVGTETTHFKGSDEEREAAYARLLDFVRYECFVAQECGAIIGIEPVALHTLCSPEMTRRMLSEVNHPSLKIILDLANLVTPETCTPEAQLEILKRALDCFGEHIVCLHIKDGVFDESGKWQNRPLGKGIMDWPTLLPILRAHDDSLCASREAVWPGLAEQECALLHKWAGC